MTQAQCSMMTASYPRKALAAQMLAPAWNSSTSRTLQRVPFPTPLVVDIFGAARYEEVEMGGPTALHMLFGRPHNSYQDR